MEQYHIPGIRCCSFHISYFIDCWQTLWMIGHFSSHPCFVFIQCFSLLLLHAVLYIRDGYRLNSTFLRLALRMIRSLPWHHRVLAIFMEQMIWGSTTFFEQGAARFISFILQIAGIHYAALYISFSSLGIGFLPCFLDKGASVACENKKLSATLHVVSVCRGFYSRSFAPYRTYSA